MIGSELRRAWQRITSGVPRSGWRQRAGWARLPLPQGRRERAVLLGALTVFVLAVTIGAPLVVSNIKAAQAAAIVKQAQTHHTHVFPTRPEWEKHVKPGTSQGSGNLQYQGGPVHRTPTSYVVFWGSSWSNGGSGVTPDAQVVLKYFQDIGATTFENILTQYSDGGGNINNTHTLEGYWLDTSTPPTDSSCGANTIEDTSIQAEVQHAITANGWPTDTTNATYYVYTPTGYLININESSTGCSNSPNYGFCGYHSAIPVGPSYLAYGALPYPDDLAACGTNDYPNGNSAGDSLVNVTSHEQFESITDPIPCGYGCTGYAGWVDAANYEIGDKCAWQFTGDTDLNSGGIFSMQQEYSNAISDCTNASHIQVSPGSVQLSTPLGVNPAPQTVTLSNAGAGDLEWTAGSLPSWVSVSPTSGTLHLGQSTSLTFSFTLAGVPQAYSTKLQITGDASDNSPYSIPISVQVIAGSTQWYFAEGYTGGTFTTLFTIANPNPQAATVTATYNIQGSSSPVSKQYSVPAFSRSTINVNNDAAVGNKKTFSTSFSANQPVVIERPMYFTYPLNGTSVRGGFDVMGATGLNSSFDFGYLDSTANHTTLFTVLNPSAATMYVNMTFYPQAGGSPISIQQTVQAKSRGTVNLTLLQPTLPAGVYSGHVLLTSDSTGTSPVSGLVERPMYVTGTNTGYEQSTCMVGVPAPATSWYFAEGYTGNAGGTRGQYHEQIVLAYPVSGGTTTSANVTLTLMPQGGGGAITAHYTLAPNTMQFVNVNSLAPNATISATVTSDQPVLAERIMSFNTGATDVLGITTPGHGFVFAEGYTANGFTDLVTIQNPSASQTASITVAFLPQGSGSPTVETYTLAPQSRTTVNANNILGAKTFSTQVSANIPVVAERPMYFNYGGTDVFGFQPAGS